MKGPFERLKYDLRRVWECPACRHRERSGGDRTSCWCSCQEAQGGAPVGMHLISEGGRREVAGESVRPS